LSCFLKLRIDRQTDRQTVCFNFPILEHQNPYPTTHSPQVHTREQQAGSQPETLLHLHALANERSLHSPHIRGTHTKLHPNMQPARRSAHYTAPAFQLDQYALSSRWCLGPTRCCCSWVCCLSSVLCASPCISFCSQSCYTMASVLQSMCPIDV
jgi:hypothetical protein